MFTVPRGGGTAPIRKILRIMSIVIGLFGLSFVGWRYFQRQEPEAPKEIAALPLKRKRREQLEETCRVRLAELRGGIA